MFQIRIDGSPAYECAADDTLLRAGLRSGLGLPYECNSGSCGACKVELLAGRVESNWPQAPGLTERDRAKKRILACQSRPVADCVLNVRLRDDYRPHHRPRRFHATLISSRDLTYDMREFAFRTEGAPGFLPGQYALFTLPGVAGLRAYSMSNVDYGSGIWEFQVRRVPGGAGTAVLFDRLAAGSRVELDGPYGLAYLRTDSPRDLLCIGGGSGLSAVLSVVRGAVREPALTQRQIHFFYGVRGPRDLCGEDLLAALPGYGARIHFTPAISMPELDTDGSWRGKIGFVHDVVHEAFGDRLSEFEIYFAGPPAMARAVQAMLAEKRVPQRQIHFDSFY